MDKPWNLLSRENRQESITNSESRIKKIVKLTFVIKYNVFKCHQPFPTNQFNQNLSIPYNNKKERPGTVSHAYNLSYLEGKDRRITA
jgi:hypothetical protein